MDKLTRTERAVFGCSTGIVILGFVLWIVWFQRRREIRSKEKRKTFSSRRHRNKVSRRRLVS